MALQNTWFFDLPILKVSVSGFHIAEFLTSGLLKFVSHYFQ